MKISPNMANDTTVAKIVPQVKLAEPNNDRSTSGSPPRPTRRSQATNATSATTPATITGSARALAQPCCPASISP